LRQPYCSEVSITEYTTGRSAKVEGLLFGSGEKLGEWEAFTLFFVRPGAAQCRSLEVSQKVTVGDFHKDAMVARILRGTKAGAHGRPQYCYYVLLKVGTDFKYAALQHVHDMYQRMYGRPQLADQWMDDTSFSGMPPTANQLSDFKPKSVSAVAKAAAAYVKKLAESSACV
jgi:hypothetical protein